MVLHLHAATERAQYDLARTNFERAKAQNAVKLISKAKTALRNRSSVTFTVNATLTDAAHLKGTKSKTVTIRR